jgi:hypothetical protein
MARIYKIAELQRTCVHHEYSYSIAKLPTSIKGLCYIKTNWKMGSEIESMELGSYNDNKFNAEYIVTDCSKVGGIMLISIVKE